MVMSRKVENGYLMIDLEELLDGFTSQDKCELAERLACYDEVIERVAQQIITGWTDAGSHGYNDCNEPEPKCPLGKATRAVALGAGGVAARQVEGLASTMRRQYAYHDQIKQWAWTMYHTMVAANRERRECPPPPECPSAYNADADAFVVVANNK
jgi:hypothetical protein